MLISPEQFRQAKAGDPAAFEAITTAYRRRIEQTLVRLIRAENVDAMVNDVFQGLHRSIQEISSPFVFEPWLHRLTVNTAYDYLRRRRRAGNGES